MVEATRHARWREASDRFVAFLEYLGYPDSAIIRNLRIGHTEVDFAIVDPTSRRPIMVFELTVGESEGWPNKAVGHLSHVRRSFDPLVVSTYAVRVIPERGEVQIYELTDRMSRLVTPQDLKLPSVGSPGLEVAAQSGLPTLAAAGAATASQTTSRLLTRWRNAVDGFKLICWTAASVIAVLGILDYLGMIALETKHLSLLAVVVVLMLAPFSSKLKFLGIEFERIQAVLKKDVKDSKAD